MADATCLECNGEKFVLLCARPDRDCTDFPDGCLAPCSECDATGTIPDREERPDAR